MKLSFFCYLTILKFSLADSVTIKCRYYLDYNNFYACNVMNAEVFTGDRVSIEKAEGQHLEGKTNDDVESFWIFDASNLKFFPSNINNIFKNLINIRIMFTNIAEITSENLKVFPELKFLHFFRNQIEVIKEDTFKFNPKLEEIYMDNNKISHIDPKSFSELKSLEVLDLSGNVCSLRWAENRDQVLEMVKKIEEGFCLSKKF
ncbi:hypothetical protein PVAND_008700 [Polypedilum vanderplanki]|uniref:Uncharacterized protein n=1 Tax=Polypedilum vanderplanki TaxID=319348 RepID=A0A9J6CAF6_POLVA|nr:hypothetical protein PVAND_008700 [Polypedilum vanderplanki]